MNYLPEDHRDIARKMLHETRRDIRLHKAYEHFRLRLKERYRLDITFEEYKDLCIAECVSVKRIENKRRVVKVSFKNVIVVAIKGYNGGKAALITALPIEHLIKYM